jgi:hypothetical protein
MRPQEARGCVHTERGRVGIVGGKAALPSAEIGGEMRASSRLGPVSRLARQGTPFARSGRRHRVAALSKGVRMDMPSCAVVIIGAAVASLVFGGAMGPRARAGEGLSVPVATASSSMTTSGTACARGKAQRNTAPPIARPTGSSDMQMNAEGTGVAGAAGTVPDQARGDPCEPSRRLGQRRAAASAAAAATPTKQP